MSFYLFVLLLKMLLLLIILVIDGVPKEGLRIQDVLVRIAVLLLVRDKVSLVKEYFHDFSCFPLLCI